MLSALLALLIACNDLLPYRMMHLQTEIIEYGSSIAIERTCSLLKMKKKNDKHSYVVY